MPYKNITQIARELRKNQTPSEKILWNELRNRKLEGFKFLRQHPIIYEYYKKPYFFIADFYCAERVLVVELDGKIHDYQKEKDYQRDLIIKEMGLEVLRIKNEELRDLKRVKEKIIGHL